MLDIMCRVLQHNQQLPHGLPMGCPWVPSEGLPVNFPRVAHGRRRTLAHVLSNNIDRRQIRWPRLSILVARRSTLRQEVLT